jgi:hypothetical protein
LFSIWQQSRRAAQSITAGFRGRITLNFAADWIGGSFDRDAAG